MAIIQTAPSSSYTLDALNEAVTFGPGFLDISTSDTDVIWFSVSAPTSTLDFQCQISLDGSLWTPRAFGRGKTSFGATIQLAASTVEDVCSVSHTNAPYVRFIITAYTSGSITVGSIMSSRYFTR